KLTKKDRCWLVPSQTGQGQYYVNPYKQEASCTCPDHQESGHKCKHIFAVEFVIQRELFPDGTEVETKTVTMTETVVRKSYPQQWREYNAAQVNEKDHFQSLLHDLCKGLMQPEVYSSKGGRPSIPLEDSIFAAIFKVYSTVSGRRFMSDLRDSQEKGFINRLPCYNSIFNVLENPATTPVLHALIQATSAPLQAVETTFAADSSGFSASRFDRWYDKKYGGVKSERAWVKCHLMCGVKTNVVTSVIISDGGDCPQLPALLATTRQTFKVKEVCADLAYSSEDNLYAIVGADAAPLIPFKSNTTSDKGGLWAKMFHYFKFKSEEFMARYHQRSNVESTFSMVKAKFGDSVRSKTDVAMANEVLAKIVCHNICCLISAVYELGIDVSFWAESRVAQQPAAI
ncbi:MAG: transposase, partial [Pirellulaceae bacterium]|nr:transposase [Pirellulaceae bacterium]